MNPYEGQQSSGSGGLKIAILFGAVIALLAANIYLFLQVDRMRTDIGGLREALQAEVAKLRETTSVAAQTSKTTINRLSDQLDAARRQAAMAAGQAKVEAQKHADDIAAKLAAEQAKQAKLQQETAGQVAEVKQAATATAARVGEVSTEVGNVKTDLTSTKGELEKTIAGLKRVSGDLDNAGSLIATNAKELGALKQLGERNYFEFNLAKTKAPQKVGDIMVLLKKVDTKRNKYTIEVVADDKRVEKKDKNINEPVQFYVSRARQPYEIVVNEVKKDQIAGYLATPKVQTVRN